MGLSDIIAAYIQERLSETDGSMELQRNVLAEELGCVPSQINYVLTSRFGPEQGYIIESKRGGGGYIRITKMQYGKTLPEPVRIANMLGERIDRGNTYIIIQSLLEKGAITEKEARILSVAISEQVFKDIPIEKRDFVRSTMLKQLLRMLRT